MFIQRYNSRLITNFSSDPRALAHYEKTFGTSDLNILKLHNKLLDNNKFIRVGLRKGVLAIDELFCNARLPEYQFSDSPYTPLEFPPVLFLPITYTPIYLVARAVMLNKFYLSSHADYIIQLLLSNKICQYNTATGFYGHFALNYKNLV